MKKVLTLLLCGAILATTTASGNNKNIAEAAPNAALTEVSSTSSSSYFNIPAVTAGAAVSNKGVAATDAVKPIIAGEPVPGRPASTVDPSDKALQSAITAVKSKITIPAEYSVFDYYFNAGSSNSGNSWNLTWRKADNTAYIQVSCDGNYNITNYNKYDNNQSNGTVPAYLKKELEAKAKDFIKQIAPEIYSKLEYVDAEYEGVYSGLYDYTYKRVENGISFADNNVVIGVDSVTGEVRSASIAWTYGVAVPSPEAKITKEQAAELIGKNLKMNLEYRINYYHIYDSAKGVYQNEKKAFLVYEPSLSYVSVDAKTGKVYTTSSEWVQKEDNGATKTAESAAGVGMANDKGSTNVTLTDEEIAKINELQKLISKDKAIDIVTKNKSLFIDQSLTTYTANLTKVSNGSNTASYVWNIELRDARPVDYQKNKDTYRAYANAAVNAETGKILSFYASLKSNYDDAKQKWNSVKIKYDKKTCQTTLESFLKAQVSSRFGKTKLVDTREDYIAYYKADNAPVYGGYSYQYNRFNEGVEFSYNGIYGSVDGVSGKIYSYSTNWDDDVIFESPKGAMTPEQAFDKYISKDGYGLVYEVNEINTYDPNYKGTDKYYENSEAYSYKQEIRLVYRTDAKPQYISPFTGDQLNYNGEVYTETKPYTYTDVPENDANRAILIFADMNIGFEGDKFYPDNAITTGELDTLLEKTGYGSVYPESSDGNTAPASNKLITKEEIALTFIKRLGLEKIADLQGIYNTGYYDQNSISSDYLGAVALAKGLGLITADASNNFNPKNNVTRAQAVNLIMNYIKVQKKGIYY